MEGIGDHIGGVLEEPQKLPGSRVKYQIFCAGDFPPGPGQLDDGQTGAPGELLGVGRRLSGVGDEIAQNIPPLPLGGDGQLPPFLPGEQKGGVQDHPRLPPSRLTQEGLSPLLPDGEGGEGLQKGFQLTGLVRRQLRDPKAGGVGNPAFLPGEGQQEGGVELLVLKNIGVPNLVAARQEHVAVRGLRRQLPGGGILPGGQRHLPGYEVLKPLEPPLKRGVMEGGVSIGGQVPHGAPALEHPVGPHSMGQAVVDDLTLRPQGLHRPHGGIRLELCAVVVGKVEGDESCAHKLFTPERGLMGVL